MLGYKANILKIKFLRFISKGILNYNAGIYEKSKLQLLNAIALLLNTLNFATLIPYIIFGFYWQFLLVSIMIIVITLLKLLLKRKNTFLFVKFSGFQTVILFIFFSSAVHGYQTVFNHFYLIILASMPFVFSSNEKKYLCILILECIILYYLQILYSDYLINFHLMPKGKENIYTILMLINIFTYLFGLSLLSVISMQYMENKLLKLKIKLYHTKKQLTEQNRDLQTFGMAATHSLKTPLFIINSFLIKIKENIESNGSKTVSKYYINLIRDSNRLNEKYSNDLISYTSVYNLEENFQKINIKNFVENCCRIYFFKEKKIQIINNLDDTYIFTNANSLEIIILNLVDNALKYNKSEIPTVKIYSQKHENGALSIYFEDNGIGIREDFKNRIFDPFNRINDMETNLGSGLGLTIARLAALKINATLQLFFSSKNGSIFKLNLYNENT